MSQAPHRFRDEMIKHLYAGKLLKEFARPGCNRNTTARLAYRCGFQRRFLREEEFIEVMQRRKQRGQL